MLHIYENSGFYLFFGSVSLVFPRLHMSPKKDGFGSIFGALQRKIQSDFGLIVRAQVAHRQFKLFHKLGLVIKNRWIPVSTGMTRVWSLLA